MNTSLTRSCSATESLAGLNIAFGRDGMLYMVAAGIGVQGREGDRAADYAMKGSAEGLRLQSVVALGSILTEHDPIQDVDIGVRLEQSKDGQAIPHADQLAMLKILKGRSAALKLHAWSGTMEQMPARVVWKA